MHLDECYRLLDLDPAASDEEIKRAYRDLTKVWHPDRFSKDASLRRKAEEKLKAINQAHEAILASRAGDFRQDDTGAWRVRSRGREVRVHGLHVVVTLVDRGTIGEEAEVFDPAIGYWMPLTKIAELRTALARRRMRRNRGYAMTCAIVAVFILLRRPTPGGLVIAVGLFVAAFVFIARMRSAI